MTKPECIRILTAYNAWRRGGNGEMPHPAEIGMAVDYAIKALEEKKT